MCASRGSRGRSSSCSRAVEGGARLGVLLTPEPRGLAGRVVMQAARLRRERIEAGLAARLEAYARSRRSDYRRTFTFTDGLVRLFSNEFLPLVAARNIGLTALDLLPPARRLLLKQATGAAGDVPALCREP
mgnify:CR=1 FL=1